MRRSGGATRHKLEVNGIDIKAYVVNDNTNIPNKDVIDIDFLNRNYSRYIIVKGFLGASSMTEDQVLKIFPNCIAIYALSEIYDCVEKMSKSFYKENKDSFEQIVHLLNDEFSRQSLSAYLTAKYEEDASYLYPFVITPQYFFDNQPWQTFDHEILVDCGAYIGDSIADFIRLVNGKYERIYAFEPDYKNMALLQEYCESKNMRNVEFIEKGLSDRESVSQFCAKNDMLSVFSEDGDVDVAITSLDSYLLGRKVSIIKMDIEGFELPALRGARNTIIKYRPMLYISAYHKKKDIIEIVDYIESLKLDYKWFFRIHKPLAIDAVLYVIPKERVK